MRQLICLSFISLALFFVSCKKRKLVENSSIEQIVKGKLKVPVTITADLSQYIKASEYLQCVMEIDEKGDKRGSASIRTTLVSSFSKTRKRDFNYSLRVKITVLDKKGAEIFQERKTLNLNSSYSISMSRLASTNGLPASIKIAKDGTLEVKLKKKKSTVKTPKKPTVKTPSKKPSGSKPVIK